MNGIRFFFESGKDGRYAGVLDDSLCTSGAIVSQNAGSSSRGIYYQVGGGGLNGAFGRALSSLGPHQVAKVNRQLRDSYDARFGEGAWAFHSSQCGSLLPLTSFLVPLETGNSCKAMMYSVGPRLSSDGLSVPCEKLRYTKIYSDAMREIATSGVVFSGFRITMVSSGVYRGDAHIDDFAHAAAASIIDAVCPSVIEYPLTLGQLAVLINTDRTALVPIELKGFTSAAMARGALMTSNGFIVPC